MMKKLLLLVAVLAISTFAQNTTSQNARSVRFFHGVASGPNVDVYFNSVAQGNLIASNLNPGTVSEYRNLTDPNVQALNVIVTQTGSTSNVLANQTVNLPANIRAATILIAPSNTSGANATAANTTAPGNSSLNLVVLNDQFNNGQNVPPNVGLIRFVNVAGANGTNATALSLQFSNGTVLASNVAFLSTNTAYNPLSPGNYNLQVVPAAGGQPIATQQVTLAAGQALTLFAFVPIAGTPTLFTGTDTPVFLPTQVPAATATVTVSATSGAPATSGSVTSGAVTSGAVTSGAVTSGSVTSGAQVTSGATQSAATSGVIITGFTTAAQRPVSAAGTLRCDVATLGVVCAILFTVFYRRD